ncbi:hypothetical protein Tco_1563980 [Tanacetum coccineum]
MIILKFGWKFVSSSGSPVGGGDGDGFEVMLVIGEESVDDEFDECVCELVLEGGDKLLWGVEDEIEKVNLGVDWCGMEIMIRGRRVLVCKCLASNDFEMVKGGGNIPKNELGSLLEISELWLFLGVVYAFFPLWYSVRVCMNMKFGVEFHNVGESWSILTKTVSLALVDLEVDGVFGSWFCLVTELTTFGTEMFLRTGDNSWPKSTSPFLPISIVATCSLIDSNFVNDIRKSASGLPPVSSSGDNRVNAVKTNTTPLSDDNVNVVNTSTSPSTSAPSSAYDRLKGRTMTRRVFAADAAKQGVRKAMETGLDIGEMAKNTLDSVYNATKDTTHMVKEAVTGDDRKNNDVPPTDRLC